MPVSSALRAARSSGDGSSSRLSPDDMPPGDSLEDEPSPDDRAARNAELTGMDLIQRELGGQVIGEFEG